jgi:hypothetical protein
MRRGQTSKKRAAPCVAIAFALIMVGCAPPGANPGSPEDFITDEALPAIAAGDMEAAKAIASPLYARATRSSDASKVSRMIKSLGPLQSASRPICRQIIGVNVPTGSFHRAECRVEARHAIASAVYAFSLRAVEGRWMMDGFNVNSAHFMRLMAPLPEQTKDDAALAP